MKTLFPPNKKIHTMTSRDQNHFEVFHSNTVWKKKSNHLHAKSPEFKCKGENAARKGMEFILVDHVINEISLWKEGN